MNQTLRHDDGQLETIRAALDARAEDLFALAWGEPEKRNAPNWRAKQSDAVSMVMRGIKRGLWTDHRTHEGGDLLDLVAVTLCGLTKARDDFPRVKAEAAAWCGIDTTTPVDLSNLKRRRQDREAAAKRADEAEASRKATTVVHALQAAQNVLNTPAAAYLARRGVNALPPSGLAYMPAHASVAWAEKGHHALIAWGTDDAGKIYGGQRVLIDSQGRPAQVTSPKLTFGAVKGYPARFPARIEGQPLYIAEGPETAATIWEATGAEVWAVFGAGFFEAAPVPLSRKVIFCPDRDAPDSPAAKGFAKAIAHHIARGCEVWIAHAPEPEGSKADLNDTRQRAGIEAVKDALELAEDQTPRPAYLAPQGDLAQARAVVSQAFDLWVTQAMQWSPDAEALGNTSTLPPVQLLRVSTGVGKTQAAREKAVALVAKLRARNDARPVVILTPRHNLNEEIEDKLALSGLAVEIYRGISQPDPDAPHHSMCRRSSEAVELVRAGGDLTTTLCKQGDSLCPFYDVCGKRKQDAKRADIWLAPHSLLPRGTPTCIGRPAAIVIDEDPTGEALGGFDTPITLTLDELAAPTGGGVRIETNADLTAAGADLANAARNSETNRIILADLGKTASDYRHARVEAFKAKLTPDCGPDSAPKQVKAAIAKIAPHNRKVFRMARAFGIVADAIERGATIAAGIILGREKTESGGTATTIQLHWQEILGKGWNVPTIVASATLNETLARNMWPQAGEVIDAQAATPHVWVRQVTDRTFAKSALVPLESARAADKTAAANLLGRVRRHIEWRAYQAGKGEVLVIAQLGVIEALGDTLPANVRTLHFNGLSGLDDYKDAAAIIQIGRPLPGPQAMELRAEIWAGDAIETLPAGEWYPKREAYLTTRSNCAGPPVLARGGKGQAAGKGQVYHPAPLAEAVRWGICEAELIQAIGRGRGVNRTAYNPLMIDLLCNVPLPIAVDEAGPFEAFEPTPKELMEARGVMLSNTSQKGAWGVVAAVLSDLYGNAQAAKDANAIAKQNSKPTPTVLTVDYPYKDILIGKLYRERCGTAQVRVMGARYAPEVELRAETLGEAERLASSLGLELKQGSFTPVEPAPKPPEPPRSTRQPMPTSNITIQRQSGHCVCDDELSLARDGTRPP